MLTDLEETYIHTYTHTYIHACVRMSCMHACIHIHAYIHTHTCIHTHTYIHTLRPIHTEAHTHTHTHTHTGHIPPLPHLLWTKDDVIVKVVGVVSICPKSLIPICMDFFLEAGLVMDTELDS